MGAHATFIYRSFQNYKLSIIKGKVFLTLYTKTVQLYYPFEMLLNNKLNTISSLPDTYVKCVLLKDVLLFKCISIDLIGKITPD